MVREVDTFYANKYMHFNSQAPEISQPQLILNFQYSKKLAQTSNLLQNINLLTRQSIFCTWT